MYYVNNSRSRRVPTVYVEWKSYSNKDGLQEAFTSKRHFFEQNLVHELWVSFLTN